MIKIASALTLMLLAACGSPGNGNEVLAQANSSGNDASAALENAVRQSDATPLQKERALALMKRRHCA